MTVTIPGGGGGSTGVFQAIFYANDPTDFSGGAFTDWNSTLISEATFCELSGPSILFNVDGLYRITLEGRADPGGAWPNGNKIFGTILNSAEYSTHSRFSETFQNFTGVISAGIDTNIARWADTYVLDYAATDTYTPTMYGSSYQNQSDEVTFRVKVTIELLEVIV